MNTYSTAFNEAKALLGQIPLPTDAEARLAALESQIRPEEADKFGDLWEAFYAAGGVDTLQETASS